MKNVANDFTDNVSKSDEFTINTDSPIINPDQNAWSLKLIFS